MTICSVLWYQLDPLESHCGRAAGPGSVVYMDLAQEEKGGQDIN